MEISQLAGLLEDDLHAFDYDIGLSLLRRFAPNHPMLVVLEYGPTEYNREQLHDILEEIADSLPPITTQPGEPAPQEQADTPNLDDPKEVERLWKDRFKQLNYQKQRLHPEMDLEEKREICLAIVDGFYEDIVPAWQRLDDYRDTGELPPAPPPPGAANEEAARMMEAIAPLSEAQRWGLARLKTLPSQISKAKKKRQLKKLEALQEELDHISRRLGL